MIHCKQIGILYQKWASSPSKIVFLLVHGLGGHSGRWEYFSKYFLERNISSYAIELKGFGKTKSLKGHIDSLDIYYEDILRLREIIKEENRGCRILLAGESMGGLLAFMLSRQRSNFWDGLVLLSPAFQSKLRIGILAQIDILFSSFISPEKQFSMPFDGAMCTQDEDIQKQLEQDPREHRIASAKLLVNILAAQVRSRFIAKQISIPALFLVAGKDYLVDPIASSHVLAQLPTKNKKLIDYPQLHHALSIEKDRERVFGDIYEWIQETAALGGIS